MEKYSPVVLNLGSVEPQGLGESVSGVRRQEILSNKSWINQIRDTHFIFPTTKGSMNACMEFMGFSTSNRVKNHWYSPYSLICNLLSTNLETCLHIYDWSNLSSKYLHETKKKNLSIPIQACDCNRLNQINANCSHTVFKKKSLFPKY